MSADLAVGMQNSDSRETISRCFMSRVDKYIRTSFNTCRLFKGTVIIGIGSFFLFVKRIDLFETRA